MNSIGRMMRNKAMYVVSRCHVTTPSSPVVRTVIVTNLCDTIQKYLIPGIQKGYVIETILIICIFTSSFKLTTLSKRIEHHVQLHWRVCIESKKYSNSFECVAATGAQCARSADIGTLAAYGGGGLAALCCVGMALMVGMRKNNGLEDDDMISADTVALKKGSYTSGV